MVGKIVHIEHRIGWIAIRDDRGEITIAELLGGYNVEIGNVVSGDLHTCGGSSFFNRSTNEELSVMVQYVGLNDQQAIRAIQSCR
ncbi:hypothetical protein I7V27_13620 [Lelliottia amnigena]|uniref:Uncharacterized protein n=1 Tax=Lelliottia amnigena TaxID=61646 RepID=A0AAP2F2G9_LELAM|nr:hypothetical protein [Lelliottia amnigena]MBL5899961.1 hypothetical protein [Lelliottia amnigena]MBL5935475.1 hypothetical protein [Lelliottia amnigena]